MENKYRKFYVEWWKIRKSTIYGLIAFVVVTTGVVVGVWWALQQNWFSQQTSTDAPKDAARIISFEGDVPASYRGSWISRGRQTPWGGEWRLEGDAGALEWTSRTDTTAPDTLRLLTASSAARPIALPRLAAVDRAGTLAAFVAAVRSGTEPETSGRRNLGTLALSIAAIRSATERRRVAIAELLADLPEDVR